MPSKRTKSIGQIERRAVADPAGGTAAGIGCGSESAGEHEKIGYNHMINRVVC